MRLANKVAVITGAGGGIGRATSLLFAREGASVVMADWNAETGTETAAMVTESGGRAVFVKADVSNAEDARRMARTAFETYGRLDILVNNAGLSGRTFAAAGDSEEEVWRKVMEINVKGIWLCTRYAVPYMIQGGRGGSVINIASIAGMVALGGGQAVPGEVPEGEEPIEFWARTVASGAYGASKAAVAQMTRQYALAYAKHRIRVNAIAPGFVDTTFYPEETRSDPTWRERLGSRHPLGRMGEAEDIAQAALFLASDESSFITGVLLPVDGGYTAQ